MSQFVEWAKMKLNVKKISVISLIVIVGLAAVPWCFGWIVSKKVQSAVQLFDQSPTFSVKVNNYQQGWLHSSADLSVILHDPVPSLSLNPQQSASEAPIELQCQISHGPLLLSSERQKYALGMLDCKAVGSSKSTTKLTINSLMHINGSFDLKLSAPNYHTKIDDMNLSLQQFDSTMNVHAGLKTIDIETNISNVTLQNNHEVNVSLNVLKFSGKLNHVKQGIWSGPRELSIGQINFTKIKLDGFSLSEETTIDSEVVNKLYKLAVREVHYENENEVLGPFELELRLSNLDSAAYIKMISSWDSWAHEPASSAAGQQKIAELWYQLLSNGFRINLQPVILQTPAGKFTAYGFWSFPKYDPKKFDSKSSYASLFTDSDFALIFDIPKPFLQKVLALSMGEENATKYIEQLLQSKVILDDDRQYLYSIMYKRGTLYVNEQPLKSIKSENPGNRPGFLP